MTAPAGAAWQRLSPWAVAFLLVRGGVRFARENVPVLLGAGAGVAVTERIGAVEVAAGAAVALGVALLVSLAYYRRFRFRLDDGVLVVQKGLLERTELRLTAGRVQHISLEQPVYLRPFGVVRFSATTPGSAATELELPGIRRSLAVALQAALGAPAGGAAAPDPEAGVIYRITPGAVTLHGLASNSIYLVAALLAPLVQILERFGRRWLEQMDDPHSLPGVQLVLDAPVLAGIGAVLALLVSLMALSVTVAWLRFSGFSLVRRGERFLQSSGLVGRQEQELDAARLQSLEWVQTAIGRVLGRGYLVCRQYGSRPRASDRAGRGFLVPGLVPAQARSLAGAFWPSLDPGGATEPVHPLYRRALALRLTPLLAAIPLAAAAVAAVPALLWGAALAPAAAWGLAHLRWRALAWSADGDAVRVRRGLLGRRTVAFPLARVQAVEISRSWLQRRRGLATLHLTPASGRESVPYIPLERALAVANATLYTVEIRSDRPDSVRARAGSTGRA